MDTEYYGKKAMLRLQYFINKGNLSFNSIFPTLFEVHPNVCIIFSQHSRPGSGDSGREMGRLEER